MTETTVRRVIVRVQIIDPEGDDWILAEAQTEVRLREDLLTGVFTDGAQDWYVALLGELGTRAYVQAFRRGAPARPPE